MSSEEIDTLDDCTECTSTEHPHLTSRITRKECATTCKYDPITGRILARTITETTETIEYFGGHGPALHTGPALAHLDVSRTEPEPVLSESESEGEVVVDPNLSPSLLQTSKPSPISSPPKSSAEAPPFAFPTPPPTPTPTSSKPETNCLLALSSPISLTSRNNSAQPYPYKHCFTQKANEDVITRIQELYWREYKSLPEKQPKEWRETWARLWRPARDRGSVTGREDKGEDEAEEEDDRGVYQKYYDENDIFGGGPRLRDDEGFVERLRVYIDDKDEERGNVGGDEECGWEIRQECNGLATVSDTEEDEKFMYGSEWEEQMGIMPVSGDIRICRDG